jgi:hypothetical protein
MTNDWVPMSREEFEKFVHKMCDSTSDKFRVPQLTSRETCDLYRRYVAGKGSLFAVSDAQTHNLPEPSPMTNGFWYLATPYAKYPDGPIAAFEEAAKQAGILARAGICIFCPITHSHPIHLHVNPIDAHRFWLDFDRPFMAAAKGLIVCQLTGWHESRGIREEIDYFVDAGKSIVVMQPNVIPEALL